MNFAEVSVTFDDSAKPKRLNSEYDEVTVTDVITEAERASIL